MRGSMLRVNGQDSAATFMNVYPDITDRREVLHLYIEAPEAEYAIWATEGPLNIEADWKQDLGGVIFASQQGVADILKRCAVQGQFIAQLEPQCEGGRLLVNLTSSGLLKPLESSR